MTPKTPYIYKEYPRTLHQWPDQTCTVRDDDEKAAKLADGWSLLPVMEEPKPDPEPDTLVEVVPEVEDEPAPRKRRSRKGDDA